MTRTSFIALVLAVTSGCAIDAADDADTGSIESAVTVLNVPLIVVLGHDSCGAVKATLSAIDDGEENVAIVLARADGRVWVERVGVAAVDIAGVIDCDRLDAVHLDRLQDEGAHDAVVGAAAADARTVGRVLFVR